MGTALLHHGTRPRDSLARPREGQDGALPNANAVFARALARLARHYDRDDFSQRARAALVAYGTLIEQAPRVFATSLDVLDFLESIPFELALVGRRGAPDREALECAVAERYLPNRVCAHIDPDQPEATDLPLLRARPWCGNVRRFTSAGTTHVRPR